MIQITISLTTFGSGTGIVWITPAAGGFGPGLTWSRQSDFDVDYINDLWETNAVGSALGFTTNNAPERVKMEQKWRGNWSHGWASSATVTNPPSDPYCNPYPGGYSATEGYGLCPRNEYDDQFSDGRTNSA